VPDRDIFQRLVIAHSRSGPRLAGKPSEESYECIPYGIDVVQTVPDGGSTTVEPPAELKITGPEE
jgi:hypothetical protein